MLLRKIAKEEDGMETVEYAVVGALVIAATVAVWTGLGTAIKTAITNLTAVING